MAINKDIPSYQELFGALDFETSDTGRTVFSPAAYLADLLQLMEDSFTDEDFFARRPDVRALDLNGDNTFTVAPHLSIINELLERHVLSLAAAAGVEREDAYAVLREAKAPIAMPFDRGHERLKKLQGFSKLKPADFQRLFERGAIDQDLTARERLGLSEGAYAMVTTPVTDAAGLRARYGLGEGEDFDALRVVERFLTATELSGAQLRELLYGELSQSARDSGGHVERGQASALFPNAGGGAARLDAEERTIVATDGESAPSLSWFDRANRLIRLARWTGISLVSLERALRTCAGNRIDAAGLRRLAVIVELRDALDIDIDLACALLAPVDTLGIGDGLELSELRDPFNRVFNGRHAQLAGRYLASPGGYVAEPLADFEVLSVSGDLLSLDNKAYRLHLRRALSLSEVAVTTIVERFRAHAEARDASTSLATSPDAQGLSLLFRVATLANALDLDVSELLDILDVLEFDPSVRGSDVYALLIPGDASAPTSTAGFDAHAALEAGADDAAIETRAWLVQAIVAISRWLRAAQLSTATLRVLTLGPTRDEAAEEQLRVLLDGLQQSFSEQAASAQTLARVLDPRTARLVFDGVSEPARGLTWPGRPELLTVEAQGVREATKAALDALDERSPEDFLGLGVGARVAAQVHAHLVHRGLLTPTGALAESALSEAAEDFRLSTDFDAQRGPLFELIAALFQEAYAAQGVPKAEVELSLYPSDLGALELSSEAVVELHANLQFNGLVDADELVRDAAALVDAGSLSEAAVNSPLERHAAQVHAYLRAAVEDFQAAPLIVDEAMWPALPLSAEEKTELVENLRFNGHIDAHGVVVDKLALAAMAIEDFDLAVQFYPHRRAILGALQAAIEGLRRQFLVFTADSLEPLGDAIAAEEAYAQAEGVGTDEDAPSTFLRADELARVRARVASIEEAAARYRLSPASLAELTFSAEESAELLEVLAEDELLLEGGKLSLDALDDYLTVDNALSFRVEAFEDYERDIFFAIHEVAKATAEVLDAVEAELARLAARQRQLVLDALAELLELDVAVAELLLVRSQSNDAHPSATFLATVLDEVDALGVLRAVPSAPAFQLGLTRLGQLAALVRQFGFDHDLSQIALDEQHLVEKFPERLALPAGVQVIDALLEDGDEILLFSGARFWRYDAATGALGDEEGEALSELTSALAGVESVDAAFVDSAGSRWILADALYLERAVDSERWVPVERRFGESANTFEGLTRVAASLVTRDGRTYLLTREEFLRYTGAYEFVDEGCPLPLAQWLPELGDVSYGGSRVGSEDSEGSEDLAERVDAALETPDGVTYLFAGEHYFSSEEPELERTIAGRFGVVDNDFEGLGRLDAVLRHEGQLCLFLGDQVLAYRDNLENEGVLATEGYPTTLPELLPGLPAAFHDGVDAAERMWDGQIMLFRGREFVSMAADRPVIEPRPIYERWGRVGNELQTSGEVEAAFAGLDGKVYLFSGDQYYRYSSADYRLVDEGYPRRIAPDWGGLESVDAAFVLDGKTYLFGRQGEQSIYLRFSTRDYSVADEGFPKPTDDNWWNLPAALLEAGFDRPDAVFIGTDGSVYLFGAGVYVRFDHNHRWWSEPTPISERWNSLPFERVSAGFTGKDGRSYLFSTAAPDPQFVRYSDPDYNIVDEGYPRTVKSVWGRVRNNIQRTSRVDAAMVLRSTVTQTDAEGEAVEVEAQHTYLFSGDQFYRYTGSTEGDVDEGYPKQIKSALHLEPRFVNLPPRACGSVDAAFADARNVYLVERGQIHVASVEHHGAYALDAEALGLRAAVVEEGSVYVETLAGWRQLSDPESADRRLFLSAPRSLRRVPAAFQTEVDAILHGRDGNTYVFKGPECHDLDMRRSVLGAEAWGRAENPLFDEGRVDAAFTGRDGKVYLFSGAHFVRYEAEALSGAAPGFIDGLPESISERWGLSNVRHAYVDGERTVLCEAPGDDGSFRYVVFEGEDYEGEPAEGPSQASFDYWGIPAQIVAQGFDRVDAVLVDEQADRVLVRGREFVHYEAESGRWSQPRAIELLWRGLPERHPDLEGVRAAFRAPNGWTWVFGEGACVAYDVSAKALVSGVELIEGRWGVVDNRIATRARVDAAVVLGEHTFLFSGEQYVRYSSADYRRVDAGYPKRIAGELRKEAAFAAFPESLEAELERLGGELSGISAVVGTGPTVHLMLGSHLHSASLELARSRALGALGHLRNTFDVAEPDAEDEAGVSVDAAFVDGAGLSYLVRGDQYVRYTELSREHVDSGYPRPLEQLGQDLFGVSGLSGGHLPDPFRYDIDAAFLGSDGRLHVFKGEQHLSAGLDGQGKLAFEQGSVTARWGRVHNPFGAGASDGIGGEDTPGAANVALDAAFVAGDGALYVFKGSHFARYSESTAELVDPGYPRSIRDDWGDLPPDFEAGITGAFAMDGRSYLARGDRYVRFDRPDHRRISPIGAQPFVTRWGSWNAIQLRDLHILDGLRRLLAEASDRQQLIAFLHASHGDNEEPYLLLAELFDWAIDDLRWLKRRDAFLRRSFPASPEAAFQLELLLRIAATLRECTRLGTYPSELFESAWTLAYGEGVEAGQRDELAIGDALLRFLAVLNPGSSFDVLQRQLRDELATLCRDALAAYVVAHTPTLANWRELSDYLLIDVAMSSCAETSRVKEAAAAIQLYFHRYFVNLEILDPRGELDEAVREQLRQRWAWMKNYRVWEANRKVFLYPEDFVRPELRDSKTPAFETLEDELLQGELNDVLATKVYKRYLDEYTEVSRLNIAGGYVYDDPDSPYDKELLLFGHTRTNPRRYYYRSAAFNRGQSNSVVWQPWRAVGIEINADRVYPVYAFGRTFVFWAVVEAKSSGSASSVVEVNNVEGGQEVTNSADLVYELQLHYSFYNLNEEWVQPQLLNTDIGDRNHIHVDQLYVENAERFGDSVHENIIVGAKYRAGSEQSSAFYSLSDDLVTRKVGDRPIPELREEFLTSLFSQDDATEIHAVGNVVPLNTYDQSSDGPWFSFDHKGGSFLCKPAESALGPDNLPRPLAGNEDDFPEWDRVDAAVELPVEGQLFFNKAAGRYAQSVQGQLAEAAVKEKWGKVSTAVIRDNRVDAVLSRRGRGELLVFRGDEYLRYRDGKDLAERGGPLSLAGNADELPQWSRLHAAVEHRDGKTYFFGDGVYTDSEHLGSTFSLRAKFGVDTVSVFPDDGDPPVTAAFVRGQHTYVVGQREFVRYTGSAYDSFDAGYPKESTLYAVLEDLGCTNNKSSYKRSRVYAATSHDGAVTLHAGRTVYTLRGTEVEAGGQDASVRALLAVGDRTVKFRDHSLHFEGSDAIYPLERNVHAAFAGLDGEAYLFSGSQYVSIRLEGLDERALADLLNGIWPQVVNVSSDWGVSSEAFPVNNRVDAALRTGDHTFLISGGVYVRYSGDFDAPDEGYPKALVGNPDGLPEWTGVDAATETDDGEWLAFHAGSWASRPRHGQPWSQAEPLIPRWGAVETNILTDGVDGAWLDGKRLYLSAGDELARYTLGPKGAGDIMDEGYPKTRAVVDASMTLGGRRFLFQGDRYAGIANGQEPGEDLDYAPIAGNWGNLDAVYKSGIDAALTTATHLYLFKGDEYSRYVLDDDQEAEPYEIQTARFDLIRLTTSTAAALNQALFAGGLDRLLSLDTQSVDETPAFVQLGPDAPARANNPTVIQVYGDRIASLPVSSHLDFESANGVYYWEAFFHAPFLIAQALNTAQRFEEAKAWYERIFDPTSRGDYWTFLPFLTADIQGLRDSVDERVALLEDLGVAVMGVRKEAKDVFELLWPMRDAFLGYRDLSGQERDTLVGFQRRNSEADQLRGAVASLSFGSADAKHVAEFQQLKVGLLELAAVIERLIKVYDAQASSGAQLAAYLDDPFDPHAIAALRRVAYRKSIVMSYVDNLLDWGDLLFTQYTMESIQEARMLYFLAHDLLGPRPENLATRVLSPDRSYGELVDIGDDYEFLLYLENMLPPAELRLSRAATIHDTVADTSYFYIPENERFLGYWDRVGDRLYKIRHCLNILGQRVPLPLFQPAIDPMALVLATATGGGFGGAQAALSAPTPHYRYSFLITKARALADGVTQLGGELLSVLERRDGEALSKLQTQQQGEILGLTTRVRQAQLEEAQHSLTSLEESKRQAEKRRDTYSRWISTNFSPYEIAQLALMSAAGVAHLIAGGSRIAAAAGGAAPDVLVGPFITGVKHGGTNANAIFDSIAGVSESFAEAFSIAGEVLGIVAQHERMKDEWKLQRDMAVIDIAQIEAQIEGAKAQIQSVEHEIAVLDKEIEHNEAIARHYTSKFSNEQLYMWMASGLSSLVYQGYRLALDMAKGAERAYQFERGCPVREASFVQGHYWDSQRKGLLAGARLSHDLDRMDQAFVETDARRLEVSRDVSLLDLDPLAFLQLKHTGSCEFHLDEAFYDQDFPGHYRRQIKTMAVKFDAGEDIYLNATLTQLTDRTVMEPDPKAVQFLLAPKDLPPATIRSNWKASQQVVLSRHDPYEDNNGMFELRFDSERYLPFEGTGAVSSWRLELNGQPANVDLTELVDVTVNVKYTAAQGGEAFAQRVRGMLTPHEALRYFDMAFDFGEAWTDFLTNDSDTLELTLSREQFRNMTSSAITAIYARYDRVGAGTGRAQFAINGDRSLALVDGGRLETPGLRVRSSGTTLTLVLTGDKRLLRNVNLVMTYKAKRG